MYCPNCGAEIYKSEKFCVNCGASLARDNHQVRPSIRQVKLEQTAGDSLSARSMLLEEHESRNSEHKTDGSSPRVVYVLKEETSQKSTPSLVSFILGLVMILAFVGASLSVWDRWFVPPVVVTLMWFGVIAQIFAVYMNYRGYSRNERRSTIISLVFYCVTILFAVLASANSFFEDISFEAAASFFNIVSIILQAVAASKMQKTDGEEG